MKHPVKPVSVPKSNNKLVTQQSLLHVSLSTIHKKPTAKTY